MKTTRFLSWGIIPGLAMLFILILSAGLAAQDNPKNSLVDGSWSMQFRISNNFTLSTFDGALISAKKHLSDKTALRFGIDINWNYLSDDMEGYLEGDRTRSNASISLKTQILKYISPKSHLSFYFGIGPNLSYSRTKDDYDYLQGSDPTRRLRYNYSRSIGLGLLGSWGLEWFFTRNMSLLAEYGAGAEYEYQRVESFSDPELRVDKYKQFQFFSNKVNFGLSVYF